MSLSGRRVAILVENQYEEIEFWYPFYRMKEAGAEVISVGSGTGDMYKGKHGIEAEPSVAAENVEPSDIDALIVPGGYAPDYLRRHAGVLKLVRDMDRAHKPIAAICHAGWVLISAGIVRGREMTCFSSIKDDVVNAGAKYLDKPVVRDGNLITSRSPADLPVFCKEIISVLDSQRMAAVPRRAR